VLQCLQCAAVSYQHLDANRGKHGEGSHGSVLHRVALYCTVLHCVALWYQHFDANLGKQGEGSHGNLGLDHQRLDRIKKKKTRFSRTA